MRLSTLFRSGQVAEFVCVCVCVLQGDETSSDDEKSENRARTNSDTFENRSTTSSGPSDISTDGSSMDEDQSLGDYHSQSTHEPLSAVHSVDTSKKVKNYVLFSVKCFSSFWSPFVFASWKSGQSRRRSREKQFKYGQ